MTAVHGSQLNKPGLGSSTLRKNGSRIVPRNLSQANASLFRNIRVGGSWGSQSTQIANFQALRFSANPSGAAPRAMGIFGGSYNVADNLKIQNGSNSFYAGQVVGQGISMALGILNQFGIIGNNKAQPQGAAAQLDNAVSSLGSNISAGEMYNKLSGATSFHDINSLQENIEQKKASLDSDYQNIGTTAKTNIDNAMGAEGVKEGLDAANVNIDTNKVKLSTLDSNDLGKNLETIKSDVGNIENFMESLGTAQTKISSESGKVKGEISAKKGELAQLEANNKDGCNDKAIQELKERIEDLEKKEKQLDAAKSAVDNINSECKSMIESLKTKEGEIKDLKKTEDSMKDKKYDLAKSQDQELGKSMAKLEKLNKDIEALKGKNDDKSTQKMAQLIQQRTAEYSNLSNLVSSLSAANATSFTNSKGTPYTIQNLSKATNMASNKPADPAPTAQQPATKPTETPAATTNTDADIPTLPQGKLPSEDVLTSMTKDQLESLKNGHRWTPEETIRLNELIDKAKQQAS